ncbi:hypothetical protein STCU_10169 [Strigomonas culicis]|uniref:Uncharacterized protein n=1 Tax=Strigomonas culicis TaxID=28005 RepID=S9TN24_9TRYP|nr:hypothetical protein STCU_10169 [Strigomonas culicis]|eukprot:EPY18124.1 hypothetical protein STCU_10169 [Strigomonas culicis]
MHTTNHLLTTAAATPNRNTQAPNTNLREKHWSLFKRHSHLLRKEVQKMIEHQHHRSDASEMQTGAGAATEKGTVQTASFYKDQVLDLVGVFDLTTMGSKKSNTPNVDKKNVSEQEAPCASVVRSPFTLSPFIYNFIKMGILNALRPQQILIRLYAQLRLLLEDGAAVERSESEQLRCVLPFLSPEDFILLFAYAMPHAHKKEAALLAAYDNHHHPTANDPCIDYLSEHETFLQNDVQSWLGPCCEFLFSPPPPADATGKHHIPFNVETPQVNLYFDNAERHQLVRSRHAQVVRALLELLAFYGEKQLSRRIVLHLLETIEAQQQQHARADAPSMDTSFVKAAGPDSLWLLCACCLAAGEAAAAPTLLDLSGALAALHGPALRVHASAPPPHDVTGAFEFAYMLLMRYTDIKRRHEQLARREEAGDPRAAAPSSQYDLFYAMPEEVFCFLIVLARALANGAVNHPPSRGGAVPSVSYKMERFQSLRTLFERLLLETAIGYRCHEDIPFLSFLTAGAHPAPQAAARRASFVSGGDLTRRVWLALVQALYTFEGAHVVADAEAPPTPTISTLVAELYDFVLTHSAEGVLHPRASQTAIHACLLQALGRPQLTTTTPDVPACRNVNKSRATSLFNTLQNPFEQSHRRGERAEELLLLPLLLAENNIVLNSNPTSPSTTSKHNNIPDVVQNIYLRMLNFVDQKFSISQSVFHFGASNMLLLSSVIQPYHPAKPAMYNAMYDVLDLASRASSTCSNPNYYYFAWRCLFLRFLICRAELNERFYNYFHKKEQTNTHKKRFPLKQRHSTAESDFAESVFASWLSETQTALSKIQPNRQLHTAHDEGPPLLLLELLHSMAQELASIKERLLLEFLGDPHPHIATVATYTHWIESCIRLLTTPTEQPHEATSSRNPYPSIWRLDAHGQPVAAENTTTTTDGMTHDPNPTASGTDHYVILRARTPLSVLDITRDWSQAQMARSLAKLKALVASDPQEEGKPRTYLISLNDYHAVLAMERYANQHECCLPTSASLSDLLERQNRMQLFIQDEHSPSSTASTSAHVRITHLDLETVFDLPLPLPSSSPLSSPLQHHTAPTHAQTGVGYNQFATQRWLEKWVHQYPASYVERCCFVLPDDHLRHASQTGSSPFFSDPPHNVHPLPAHVFLYENHLLRLLPLMTSLRTHLSAPDVLEGDAEAETPTPADSNGMKQRKHRFDLKDVFIDTK